MTTALAIDMPNTASIPLPTSAVVRRAEFCMQSCRETP
jgi:hypothetical protein